MKPAHTSTDPSSSLTVYASCSNPMTSVKYNKHDAPLAIEAFHYCKICMRDFCMASREVILAGKKKILLTFIINDRNCG